MRSLLIFSQLSDLIYINCCPRFVKHVKKLAEKHGLLWSDQALYSRANKFLDPNVVIQLFMPLITSHRLMKEQFGNPYNSVQCEDGISVVFCQFMGFLFLQIGDDEVSFLRRSLNISVTIINYVCGPDVSLLKASEYYSNLVDSLLKTWRRLFFTEQTFLVEAVEQILVNIQLSSSLIKSLQNAATTLQSSNNPPGCQVHALLFMGTKLLSLYSTKRSSQLTSEDILFLIILCQSTRKTRVKRSKENTLFNRKANGATNYVFKSHTNSTNNSSARHQRKNISTFTTNSKEILPDDSCDSSDYELFDQENEFDDASPSPDLMKHYCILLKNHLNSTPFRAHIKMLHSGLYLVILCEAYNISPLISTLTTGLQLANEFNESRRDIAKDKQFYEQLETLTKKILDLLKKQKNMTVRNELSICWDRFKSRFNQYIKTKDVLHLHITPLIDFYCKLLKVYFNKKEFLKGTILNDLDLISNKIQSDISDFLTFLQVKAYGNFDTILETKDSETVNKYLEEFPGLVHFIFIDRNRHYVTLPSLTNCKDEVKLTKQKIWEMVKFGQCNAQQGVFSILWKDQTFSYAYFLWFEDSNGQPIAPKTRPELPWDDCPLPGVLCGDFYRRLLIEAFGSLSNKTKCLELYCVHLGLATSSCVLGHSKRLASTICEITGGNSASVLTL